MTKRVGRHWLVGGGFSYFSSEAASSASASYRYTVVDPKAQEYQREFAQSLEVDPLVLEVRDDFRTAWSATTSGSDCGCASGERSRPAGSSPTAH